MSKFTPGPWEWDCRYNSLSGANQPVISYEKYEGSWLSYENQVANARLIAAAPEMYALLQGFVTDITDEDHRANDWSEQVLVRNARALLSKIDGTEG